LGDSNFSGFNLLLLLLLFEGLDDEMFILDDESLLIPKCENAVPTVFK
jgi:hypothetical protein